MNYNFDFQRRLPRGLHHIIVHQRVMNKNGREIPVIYLLLPNITGVVTQSKIDLMTKYLLENTSMSKTWMLDTVRTFGLFCDYIISNKSYYGRLKLEKAYVNIYSEIMSDFTFHYFNGTINIESPDPDPMGLYWFPRTRKTTKASLARLQMFGRWLRNDKIAQKLTNILYVSGGDDQSCPDPIGFFTKRNMGRQISFLSHLKRFDRERRESGVVGRTVSIAGDHVRAFPDQLIGPLIHRGFLRRNAKKTNDLQNEDIVAKILTLFMLFGGLRKSEPHHLFVSDVQLVDGNFEIFLHHPEDGSIKVGSEKTTRELLVLSRFHWRPRTVSERRFQAGWKGVKGDAKGTPVFWLPIAGIRQLINNLLKHYMFKVRPQIMESRRKLGLPDHPYLLVSSGGSYAATQSEIGAPYTMSAYRSAWDRMLARLKRVQERTPEEWDTLTPHTCRHFYGSFLARLKVDGRTIQRCMHHFSPRSHLVYTELPAEEINDILSTAANSVLGGNTSVGRSMQDLSNAIAILRDDAWGMA